MKKTLPGDEGKDRSDLCSEMIFKRGYITIIFITLVLKATLDVCEGI